MPLLTRYFSTASDNEFLGSLMLTALLNKTRTERFLHLLLASLEPYDRETVALLRTIILKPGPNVVVVFMNIIWLQYGFSNEHDTISLLNADSITTSSTILSFLRKADPQGHVKRKLSVSSGRREYKLQLQSFSYSIFFSSNSELVSSTFHNHLTGTVFVIELYRVLNNFYLLILSFLTSKTK